MKKFEIIILISLLTATLSLRIHDLNTQNNLVHSQSLPASSSNSTSNTTNSNSTTPNNTSNTTSTNTTTHNTTTSNTTTSNTTNTTSSNTTSNTTNSTSSNTTTTNPSDLNAAEKTQYETWVKSLAPWAKFEDGSDKSTFFNSQVQKNYGQWKKNEILSKRAKK